MAITVVLQDEDCSNISEPVHDTGGAIARGIADLSGASVCARFIDPCGDTIFNHLQATVLLEEWDRMKPAFSQNDAEQLWTDVRELIVRCSSEVHVYIRFIGD